jgi:hypothetical protein
MRSNLSELFDEYSLRARVYPSLLTTLPVLATTFLLWPNPGLKALWPVVVSVGGVFFLANWVRSRGKVLENRLVARWKGMPTTHLLRYREDHNPATFSRRRRGLERIYGESLPDAGSEGTDPTATDAIYVAATRALIARVRDDPKKYPRVHEENVQYGFRRNLLAMKPIGLSLVALVLAIDVAVTIGHFYGIDVAALVIDILVGIGWLFVVTETWVRQAGHSYAERLFETLEQDGLTAP